jgi:hypothetical protein
MICTTSIELIEIVMLSVAVGALICAPLFALMFRHGINRLTGH